MNQAASACVEISREPSFAEFGAGAGEMEPTGCGGRL